MSATERGSALLLAALLARRIAGVALGFLVGFERGQTCFFLFLLARDARGLGGGSLFLTALGLGLFGLTRQPCLFAIGGDRLALGAALGHFRIVLARLGLEFVEKISLRLL